MRAFTYVCVCVCVRAFMRACVRVCICMRVRAWCVRARVRACVFTETSCEQVRFNHCKFSAGYDLADTNGWWHVRLYQKVVGLNSGLRRLLRPYSDFEIVGSVCGLLNNLAPCTKTAERERERERHTHTHIHTHTQREREREMGWRGCTFVSFAEEILKEDMQTS